MYMQSCDTMFQLNCNLLLRNETVRKNRPFTRLQLQFSTFEKSQFIVGISGKNSIIIIKMKRSQNT